MTSLVIAVASWIVAAYPATTAERANGIASTIVTVACPEGESPECIRYTAALLGVGTLESGWREDVGTGELRGDDGRSVGYWQIHCRKGDCDRWLDLSAGATEALRIIRLSERACTRHGRDAALRAYVSGSCHKGAKASCARVQLWRKIEAELSKP